MHASRRDSLGQLLPEAEPSAVTLLDVRRCQACFVCPHHCENNDATGSNDKGWDEEHEFRSWKQLFMLEMEERLVRAHKDYHESVQRNINSTVQFLAALVALLGTISLILFTESKTHSHDEMEHQHETGRDDSNRTASGAEERLFSNINDTGMFSARWWFNIAITLTSLVATGLSNRAGRRAKQTEELIKDCNEFFSTQKVLVRKYRRVLEVQVVERPTYAKFQESVRYEQAKGEHFVTQPAEHAQSARWQWLD
tara:strand:+ start:232 stop:993 length:762 start_codon:yes stop_codon:yes gene_type:complete